MARIANPNDISVVYIRAFRGLNENPDGETTLKVGEFSQMWNFRITKDGHLQKRPGTKKLLKLPGTGPELYGVWHGTVGGKAHTLVNYAGTVFDVDPAEGNCRAVGQADREPTHFFGFGDKVYLLDGRHYAAWEGKAEGFQEVEGYIPLIQTATTPSGSGTLLEAVNRLTGKRRVEFSPDGKADTFQLPETGVDEVLEVELVDALQEGYTADLAAGTVKLSSAPAAGTNTLKIVYRKGSGARSEVTRMGFSELFNGATDARVFLYGDESNRAIYSGVEYASGKPSAEYFPDYFEVAVGESNTPLTALVRQYGRLMAYKPGSAWVITAGSLTTEAGRLTPAFYVAPVNRQFGNEAMGQVKLLENDPLTLDEGGVFQWRNVNGYVSNSENNATRVSDRVAHTLGTFDLAKTRTYNLKGDHEFWLVEGTRALVYNYANNAWYLYTDLPFQVPVEVEGQVYGFSETGEMVHFHRAYRNDVGTVIDCYAETGAMDFGRDWQLKYSPLLYVAIRPEPHARVQVTVESNRRSGYPERLVSANLSTFGNVDFGHFSFITNRKPQVRRLRLKVKKAAFYRLIYKSRDNSATATVIETDVRLRYAGNVR